MTDPGPEVGAQFGPYLLKRLVGSGGMGRVYEAQDTVLDRVVALKLISGTYAQDPDYRKRLQREARIAGRLQDPHVVPIHAAGEIDGQLYVDMRLIKGTDLETILRTEGGMPPARAVSIIRQVASALDAAHEEGVMHRDIKPGNILITANDFAYLVDFGIANASTEEKLTQMGDVLGTWAYMAPERFRGDNNEITPSSDIYALACVLYECLTGVPPYTGDRLGLIGGHISGPIPRASLRTRTPEQVDAVIARGMAKRPEERYATAGEFARAAEEIVGSVVTPAVDVARTDAIPGIDSGPQSLPYAGATHLSFPPGTPPPLAPHAQASFPSQAPPWHAGLPPPPQATKNRGRWIAVAAAVVPLVAAAAGIGIWQLTGNDKATEHSTAGPTPSAAPSTKPNISNLDVGKYVTDPRNISERPTAAEAKFVEAFRLADGLANPYQVDPIFVNLNGVATPDPKAAATSITLTNTPVVQPVLEKYGMISAFQIVGISIPFAEYQRKPSGDLILMTLSSFPNPDAAAHAATEMDQADFAVSPDNRHLTIPGVPDAKAHYRPGLASVAATMARSAFVVSILFESSTVTSIDPLITRAQKFLQAQQPLMDALVPDSEAGLMGEPVDPDHILSRMLAAAGQPVVSEVGGALGTRASALCEDAASRKQGLLTTAGVDRCGISREPQLLRAKDDAAAIVLLPAMIQAQTERYVQREVAPPANVPKAQCFEQKQNVWAANERVHFVCGVIYGRYVAWVRSAEENDVRQRAAAQYAILVNSA
jgi:serine/threonine kinase PknH